MGKKTDIKIIMATYMAPKIIEREGQHPKKIAKLACMIADAIIEESKKGPSDYKIAMKELNEYLGVK